jgi:threonine dehydrogenase-like Zn-dependent dehydrogenase
MEAPRADRRTAARPLRLGHISSRYTKKLLGLIQEGKIDPSFVITHRMRLDDAAHGYEMFLNKEDDSEKIVLRA